MYREDEFEPFLKFEKGEASLVDKERKLTPVSLER
jgi:hypothetical protein